MDYPDTTTAELGDDHAWFVAGGSCQPFSFQDDDGTAIVGQSGTTFAPSQHRTLLLKEGKLLTMAGKLGVVIETAHGHVHIPANAASIVEQKASGVVTIANLAGGKTTVKVQSRNQSKDIDAMPGEEIILADAGLAEEEMISVDGVDREPIGGAIAIADTVARRNKFDRRMMAARDELLICRTECFDIHIRMKFQMMKQEMWGAPPVAHQRINLDEIVKTMIPVPTVRQTTPVGGVRGGGNVGAVGGTSVGNGPVGSAGVPGTGNIVSQGPEFSDLQPIGFLQAPPMAVGAHGVYTLGSKAVIIKHSGRARLVLERPEVINLKGGETLITAVQPTLVKAGPYAMSMESGSIILVSKDGDVAKVRNLYESAAHSVRAHVGNKYLTIAAGQELLMSPSHSNLTKALKSEPIGRRLLKNFDMAGGHSVTRCEVSLVTLLQNCEVLKRLMISQNDTDQALAGKLIKMAAILSQVTAARGAYSNIGP